jgi:aminoglycoside phosphotransferase
MSRAVPFDVSDRFAAWKWRAVWEPDPDQPTYLMSHDDQRRFLKVAPTGNLIADEAQKLRWAGEWLTVPQVIEYGSDGDSDWLMTAELPGVDATKHPWFSEDPRRLVVALAEGLRHIHHSVPVRECPFDYSPHNAVAQVRARHAAGLIRPTDLHPEHRCLGVDGAVRELMATVPGEGPEAVCHGDYCLPNVMFTGEAVSGYLDLGRVAISDPWWDLAAGSWSVTRNLGPGWEELFLSAYGVAPDPDRLAWFRLLYDLS